MALSVRVVYTDTCVHVKESIYHVSMTSHEGSQEGSDLAMITKVGVNVRMLEESGDKRSMTVA